MHKTSNHYNEYKFLIIQAVEVLLTLPFLALLRIVHFRYLFENCAVVHSYCIYQYVTINNLIHTGCRSQQNHIVLKWLPLHMAVGSGNV